MSTKHKEQELPPPASVLIATYGFLGGALSYFCGRTRKYSGWIMSITYCHMYLLVIVRGLWCNGSWYCENESKGRLLFQTVWWYPYKGPWSCLVSSACTNEPSGTIGTLHYLDSLLLYSCKWKDRWFLGNGVVSLEGNVRINISQFGWSGQETFSKVYYSLLLYYWYYAHGVCCSCM